MSLQRVGRNPMTDAVAVAWVGGLVAWYAGGSSALDRVLVSDRLWRYGGMVVVGALLLGAVHAWRRGGSLKSVLTQCLLSAAAGALLASTLLPLVNRYGDRGPGRSEWATLTRFRNPNKGPRMASFQLLERENPSVFSLQAESAQGCTEGDRARLEVREGLLSIPWVSEVVCERSK